MRHFPHTILVLFCTLFIAADEPQKPSLDTDEKVAKAYYAQVRKAAKKSRPEYVIQGRRQRWQQGSSWTVRGKQSLGQAS